MGGLILEMTTDALIQLGLKGVLPVSQEIHFRRWTPKSVKTTAEE
jgi:hypothetical protein